MRDATVFSIEAGADYLDRAADRVDGRAARAKAAEAPVDRRPAASAIDADLDGPSVRLIRGDSIIPEAVRWLWDGWLARGKFHVLAGRPGTGKTTIAIGFAATVSGGGRWPDGTAAEIGNVLIWSGEDDPKDTLVPRLIANGAEMSRVYFVGDSRDCNGKVVSFDPALHMAALELEAARIGDVRLMIVDPVVSAVSGDGNSNTEVRRALQPIVDLAARLGCVALGISHFTKGSDGRDVVERVTGSLAFGAAARVVLAAAKIKDDEDGSTRRIIARAKSNIGPDSGGYGYALEQVELPDHPGVAASRLLWGDPIEGSARELLREAEADDGGERHDRAEAAEWLQEVLKDGGELERRDVLKLARKAGFSDRTIERARHEAGVSTRLIGFGAEKRSLWRLAESAISATYPPYPPDTVSGAYGGYGGAYGEAEAQAAGDREPAPVSRSWRITRPGGDPFTVRCNPAATAAEMLHQYPGASVEAVPEAG